MLDPMQSEIPAIAAAALAGLVIVAGTTRWLRDAAPRRPAPRRRVAGPAVAATTPRADAAATPEVPAPGAIPAPPPPGIPMAFAQALAERLVHHATNPLWWRDRDLNLVGANATYARAVGAASAEDAVRRGLELAPAARSLAARARASGRTSVTEERVMVAGARRVMDLIHIPLAGGEVAGFALDAAESDETGRDDAGRDDRPAGAMIDAFADVGVGVAVFGPQRDLVFHNRAFSHLFRLDETVFDPVPDFDRLLDAMRDVDRLPETRDFPAWRAERRGWFDAAQRIEQSWTLPDGAIVGVRARRREAGGLVAIFEDQTERARLAATRNELLAVHQATLDNLSEGVAVFGPDGQLKFFNRRFAEIVVVSPEMLAAEPSAEALMAHVAEFLAEPERARGLRALILSATAGREARTGRVPSTLGYVIDYHSVPLPDGNALIAFTDVTHRVDPPAAP